MMSGLLNCGCHIITDNWYTSLRRDQYLLTKKTDISGTMNPYRGAPKFFRDETIELKQSHFIRNGDVMITKYEDS